jgi:hypothetical protein
MNIWLDDVRPAPEGYYWADTVNKAKNAIIYFEEHGGFVELLDLDHDLGYERSFDGGDGIRLLDWLEETGRNYPIRLHSMNPVGVQNMRAIIQKNGWKEVF